jgi:uncharacterized coiled-coil DUF342 family protein
MKKSKYKSWMIESYLYETEDEDKTFDDGDTWTATSGKYAGKYKGKIDYFDDEEDASDYAKHGPSGMPDDDEDDEPDTKKGMDIDAGGGFGDEEPSGEEPSGEEPSGEPEGGEEKSTVDHDQIENDLDAIKDKGKISDNPELVKQIDNLVKSIESGEASPEDYEKAEEIAAKAMENFYTNDEGEKEFSELSDNINGAISRAKVDKLRKEDPEAARAVHNHFYASSSPHDLDKDLNGVLHDIERDPKIGRSIEGGPYDEIDRLRWTIHYTAGDFAEAYQNLSPKAKKLLTKAIARANESKESVKVINGKKYKAIKEESKPKKHKLQEIHERIANRMVT